MEPFRRDPASDLAENISAATIAKTSVDSVIDSLRSAMNPVHTIVELLSLLDIDRETDVVVAAQELFSNLLAQRLTALRRQLDTVLPINKPPDEIPAHIISLSIHSQPWRISTLHGLASVCSRWWRIIITTPSLWASARLSEKPELAVKMSKELPLTIHVEEAHPSELERFIAITRPHAHRWQSVFVEAHFTDHLLHHIAFQLPRLKELRFEYTANRGGRGRESL
ncbi:hypothetical protein M407DRAFT_28395 [Tulasnella calospora MUT 4182]|uniref:F-box domain-containing protein n=1 Tax=Tulasnella calospora MUT 4182 TaxID=1051891 RepID=A0A0C3KKV1_9AGAM|nr:hypothetical protein M407DRAFT_28395 [Tulasnella calospora MUT 4182]